MGIKMGALLQQLAGRVARHGCRGLPAAMCAMLARHRVHVNTWADSTAPAPCMHAAPQWQPQREGCSVVTAAHWWQALI